MEVAEKWREEHTRERSSVTISATVLGGQLPSVGRFHTLFIKLLNSAKYCEWHALVLCVLFYAWGGHLVMEVQRNNPDLL